MHSSRAGRGSGAGLASAARVAVVVGWGLAAVAGSPSSVAGPPPAGPDPALVRSLEAYLRAPASLEGPFLDALSGHAVPRLVAAIEAHAPLAPAFEGVRHDLSFESRGATWTYSLRLPKRAKAGVRSPVLVLPDHESVDAEAGIAFWAGDARFDDAILFRPVITRHREDRARFPDPQFFALHAAMAEVMRDGLAHVRRSYAVDPDRVTMTGLSQAGFLTWFYAVTFPDDLAAAVPESAGGVAVRGGCLPMVGNAAGLTVRILHAKGDTVCPFADAVAMHDALKRAGGDVTLVAYDDGDWTGKPPASRHPGPHGRRRDEVAEVMARARRRVPADVVRVLRYPVQGTEGRFRVPPTWRPTAPAVLAARSAGGALGADLSGTVYLVPPEELGPVREYRLSDGTVAKAGGATLTVDGRRVEPVADPRGMLATYKRTGDRRRLVAAEVPVR